MTQTTVARHAMALIGAAIIGLSAGHALADVTFQGQTVRMIINSKPGGGTDASARHIGALLIDHLPGKPQIVFQNLPGGAGIKANNYFFSQTKPDGMTVLSGSRTQVSPQKLRHASVKYDPAKYHFVGGTARLGTLLLIKNDPDLLARLKDPKARPVAFGDIDGERTGSQGAVWGKEFLGWNLRFVLGYQGTPEMLLAARRGEIDIVHNQNVFNLEPLLKDGFIAIAQLGNRDENGKMVARAEYANVPLLGDMLKPKLDEKAMKAYLGWLEDQTVEKWIALPPGSPEPYLKAWRAAYVKVMHDPKFIEVAKREYGGDFGWHPGDQMDKIVQALAATTDEDLEYFVELRKKHNLPIPQ